MDKQIIDQLTNLSFEGKVTFPEVVKKLAAGGIERYLMDLVGHKKVTYNQRMSHF